ncbi:hypothetical protein PWT90_08892 [Aphanocladium album]|nr:hypothetical protein PWT90_08892 [Aphanocladium album]
MHRQGGSDTSRGLLSSLNRLSMRPVSPSAQSIAPGAISPENRARYENMFSQECQGKPYLTGIEAAIIFLDSRLHKHVLSSIWEQADVTRDGRFSCDEFCQAMWLIDKEKGNYPSIPQQQHTSSHQDQSSWTQRPAYFQQPHQNVQAAPFPYGVPPPPTQQQHSTTYNPAMAHSSYIPQAITKREMFEPMICQGCEAGLVPGHTAYCCDECKDGVSTFCVSCHSSGKRCYHNVTPTKLEAGKDLKNENKDGDFGFGLKCDGCKTKLKQGMLCWHCKRCFDPNFCKDCWKRRDKRCKHASQGKVQLRRVGKSSASTEEILDGLEVVGEILGG